MRNRDHLFQHVRAAAASLLLFGAVAAGQAAQAERVFSGTVGNDYRIQMRLRREGKTLSGTYFYERLQKNLKVTGEIDTQNNFTLREFDDGGAQTGIFSGQWLPSDCEGCSDSLTGTWTRPDGKGSLAFKLENYAVDFRGPLKLVARSIREVNNKPYPHETNLEYPQLVGSATASAARFNELIRRRAMEEIGSYRRRLRPIDIGSNFDLTYRVGLANDDLISVELSFVLYFGKEGGFDSFAETINYDLKQGRVIKFDELFSLGVDYMKFLKNYSNRDIRNQYKDKKWVTEAIIQTHLNHVGEEDKWEITPEGLAFVSNPMELGPSRDGSSHIIVPYSELKEIIRSDGPLSVFMR